MVLRPNQPKRRLLKVPPKHRPNLPPPQNQVSADVLFIHNGPQFLCNMYFYFSLFILFSLFCSVHIHFWNRVLGISKIFRAFIAYQITQKKSDFEVLLFKGYFQILIFLQVATRVGRPLLVVFLGTALHRNIDFFYPHRQNKVNKYICKKCINAWKISMKYQ